MSDTPQLGGMSVHISPNVPQGQAILGPGKLLMFNGSDWKEIGAVDNIQIERQVNQPDRLTVQNGIGEIRFGNDLNLYRESANVLRSNHCVRCGSAGVVYDQHRGELLCPSCHREEFHPMSCPCEECAAHPTPRQLAGHMLMNDLIEEPQNAKTEDELEANYEV